METISQLINTLNKFNQLSNFLNKYTDLRNLWMTSLNLWNSNERKLLCYLRLNEDKSKEYWKSKDFKTYILSRVLNPNKQISLNLSDCDGITDVSSLGNVHTLNLSRCYGLTDVSSLGNVHKLDLSGSSGITDVSSLGNVHSLNLLNCFEISDVSSLANVHT